MDQPTCSECGTEMMSDSAGVLYCPDCYAELPECPECGSRNSEEDYHNDQHRYCNQCGTVYDPGNGESVEDFTFNLYGHIEGMTKSGAEEYVYEILAAIEHSTGYHLFFDRFDD